MFVQQKYLSPSSAAFLYLSPLQGGTVGLSLGWDDFDGA